MCASKKYISDMQNETQNWRGNNKDIPLLLDSDYHHYFSTTHLLQIVLKCCRLAARNRQLHLYICIVPMTVLKISVCVSCILFAMRHSAKWFMIIETGVKDFIHSFLGPLFVDLSNSQDRANSSVSYAGLGKVREKTGSRNKLWNLNVFTSVSANNYKPQVCFKRIVKSHV